MGNYRVLNKQVFSAGQFKLVPIRHEDRYKIMQWRNEQIYHLRQSEPLTIEMQDAYFENVISKLFDRDRPDQILFSFLQGAKSIGYGGLVHINWIDRNAEVSFIMNTELEKNYFTFNWQHFTSLLDQVAVELNFHKLFVCAFDLRPHLYKALEKCNYFKDAVLKDHCYYEGAFKDVVIYSKILSK